MFLNTLKNNEFLSYFLYLLLVVAFAFSAFSSNIMVNDFAFVDLLALCLGSSVLYTVLFLSFWVLSVFWINRLMTKYKILDLKGGLPIFLYALLSFTFFQTEISLDIILAILFFLFLFEQLMIVYQTQGWLYQSLNLGLLFGCAVFFYFPLVILFPWVIIALSSYKSLKWRDFILPFCGALIPFYLYSAFQFFNDQSNILFTKT